MTRRLWSHLRTGFKTGWTKLPRPLRNVAAKVELQIASIPRIDYDEAIHGPRFVRGAVVISCDFEMAWGWQHGTSRTTDFEAKGLWECAQIPALLKALERYSIPATWFTVGHLFLDRCTRGTDGRAHADMPRLGKGRFDWYRFDSGDWFQNDPCTDVYRDPAWYAPDLVEMVLKSPVGHETFITHTRGSNCRSQSPAA